MWPDDKWSVWLSGYERGVEAGATTAYDQRASEFLADIKAVSSAWGDDPTIDPGAPSHSELLRRERDTYARAAARDAQDHRTPDQRAADIAQSWDLNEPATELEAS